ncbi:MAG: GIY-YIG nuclease family protein [Anaerolineaceae bacterium]|nr:GIY-YIG nuclease family protein [Anaerolineaceae bacterium]
MRTKIPKDYILVKSGIEYKYNQTKAVNEPTENDVEVNLCREWIRKNGKRQRNICYDVSSYTLKHWVEKWAETYIANGDFIFAALLEGYKYSFEQEAFLEHNGQTRNVYFNMKLASLNEWENIKPTGFSKWLFEKHNEATNIGDLSRDARYDSSWPRTGQKYLDFWYYLFGSGVTDEIIEALNSAWKTYSNEDPPNPDNEIMMKCESFYDEQCALVRFTDQEIFPILSNEKSYIYVLFDENKDKRVKYVGQTINPSKRLSQHITCPGNLAKLKWIASMIVYDQYPCMAIIDKVHCKDADRIEKAYIYAFYFNENRLGQDIADVLVNKRV